MEIRFFNQKSDEFDPAAAVDFIHNCGDPALVLVYYSLHTDKNLVSFFDYLSGHLKVPFVGIRISGLVSSTEGYVENSISFVVLCGNPAVRLFHEKINFHDPHRTACRMISNLGENGLCIIHSGSYLKNHHLINSVLGEVQARYPNLQIFGTSSAPKPFVAVPEGVFKDYIAYAFLPDVNPEFYVDSGFKFNTQSDKEFVVTNSKGGLVYEINEKDAIEEYSRIQHMRPYMIKLLAEFGYRSDLSLLCKLLFKTNKVLYECLFAFFIKPLGVSLNAESAEVVFPLELDEINNCMVVQSNTPPGTVLRELSTSFDDQMAIYDRLQNKFDCAGTLLIYSCDLRKFLLDFDFKAVLERLRKFNCPVLEIYVFGEYGSAIPYNGKKNLLNCSVVKALGFRQ